MKTITLFTAAVVLGAMGASTAADGWIEGFDAFGEGYAYDKDVLPAPWEGALSMVARANLGRESTAGAQGPGGGWSWGHAFRPTVEVPRVGDAMVARVFLPSSIDYQSVMLALTTEKTPGSSGQFAGGAKIVIYIGGSADSRFAQVSVRVSDPSDNTLASISAAPHPFLPADAWYDVRLILREGRKVTAQYKRVEMSYWVPIGTLTVPSDFQPKYVAISAMRRGILDDVGYVPATAPGSPFAP
jgi:hypothetical protein